MPNYANGKIYKLVSDETDFVYVGSTTQPLSKRLYAHKKKAETGNSKVYTAMREVGIESFRIVLVSDHPCERKEQLNAGEERVRKEFEQGNLLNTNRCYSNVPYGLPAKEYNSKYQADNADKMKEYIAKYKTDNSDKIKEYRAKYNADNADKIKERMAKYRADNADKIKECRAKYNAANADKIKEYSARYRTAAKGSSATSKERADELLGGEEVFRM